MIYTVPRPTSILSEKKDTHSAEWTFKTYVTYLPLLISLPFMIDFLALWLWGAHVLPKDLNVWPIVGVLNALLILIACVGAVSRTNISVGDRGVTSSARFRTVSVARRDLLQCLTLKKVATKNKQGTPHTFHYTLLAVQKNDQRVALAGWGADEDVTRYLCQEIERFYGLQHAPVEGEAFVPFEAPTLSEAGPVVAGPALSQPAGLSIVALGAQRRWTYNDQPSTVPMCVAALIFLSVIVMFITKGDVRMMLQGGNLFMSGIVGTMAVAFSYGLVTSGSNGTTVSCDQDEIRGQTLLFTYSRKSKVPSAGLKQMLVVPCSLEGKADLTGYELQAVFRDGTRQTVVTGQGNLGYLKFIERELETYYRLEHREMPGEAKIESQ